MKTQGLIFIIEYWKELVILAILAIIFLIFFDTTNKKHIKRNMHDKESQQTFSVSDIDLKSSRIGFFSLIFLGMIFLLLKFFGDFF